MYRVHIHTGNLSSLIIPEGGIYRVHIHKINCFSLTGRRHGSRSEQGKYRRGRLVSVCARAVRVRKHRHLGQHGRPELLGENAARGDQFVLIDRYRCGYLYR